MGLSFTITENSCIRIRQFRCVFFWSILAILMFAGCRTISSQNGLRVGTSNQKVFNLVHMDSKQCIAFLSQLDLDEVSPVPEANAVLATGSPEQLSRASLLLDLVDAKENFVVENLGPASLVRTLPSNSWIATGLGDIRI